MVSGTNDETSGTIGSSASRADTVSTRSVTCRVCQRRLKAVRSIQAGVGPVCAKKVGSKVSSPATPEADAISDHPRAAARPMPREMSAGDMRQYLTELGQLLDARGVTGEIILAGGAVVVMVLQARAGSNDIDAVFVHEADAIRRAAQEVAETHGLPAIWLNDHVRIFVASDAPTVEFFETPGLRVRMVGLDYLFYMKAWAGDPLDQRDLRAIAKALRIKDEHEAYDIVRRYSAGALSREVQILLESLFA